ncbi:hypothetical protein OROMI_026084 [Orobanche minor]
MSRSQCGFHSTVRVAFWGVTEDGIRESFSLVSRCGFNYYQETFASCVTCAGARPYEPNTHCMERNVRGHGRGGRGRGRGRIPSPRADTHSNVGQSSAGSDSPFEN